MSVNDLRELSVTELKNKIVDLKKELMDSRFALATSQLEDTSVFKKIRKENTGKIGVWDIKKTKIKRGNVEELQGIKDS